MPLEIAGRMNTQPWKIVGGSRTLWYVRLCAVREAEIKRAHKMENNLKQRQAEIETRLAQQRRK